jgi:putative ABC transport system permease protein
VNGVTLSTLVPFQGMASFDYELPDGRTVGFGYTRVGADYFDVAGTPIVAGRPFNDADGDGMPLVAIVSETAARLLWPGQDPLGLELDLGRAGAPPRTVVGVAADVTRQELREEPGLFLYSPAAQAYDSRIYFIVRSGLAPATLASAIPARIAEVDPTVAVSSIRSLSDVVDEQSASYRSLAILVGAFGAIALLLAAIGLYGVQAYLVAQRSREIGIRMALGASAEKVANAVLTRGAALALLGLATGGVTALALSDLVRSMLFGIEPNDPATMAVAMMTLLVVGLLASWVPARRASRVDAMVAIRTE